jgi:LysR family transcriptional regulator, glycine cleavage system transcriptional activator
MASIKLFDNVGFPVCAPSLLKREPALRTPHDVLGAPLLHFEAGRASSWSQWTNYFGLDECAGGSVGVFTSTTFLLTAALEGRGVALAWQNYWDEEIAAGRLVRLTDHVIRPKTGLYLVYPKDSGSPLLSQIALFLRTCVQPASSPCTGLAQAT